MKMEKERLRNEIFPFTEALLDVHSDWGNLGDSLRSVTNDLGKVGGVALLCMALAVGCSPQSKSYWTGAFTELPAPPPNARLQVGVSTEDDGTVFINYILWDQDAHRFMREDIHYTSKKFGESFNFGDFRAAGGYRQEIAHGEVLAGGAIVDQHQGRLVFPNGTYVEGASGKVFGLDGQPFKGISSGE